MRITQLFFSLATLTSLASATPIPIDDVAQPDHTPTPEITLYAGVTTPSVVNPTPTTTIIASLVNHAPASTVTEAPPVFHDVFAVINLDPDPTTTTAHATSPSLVSLVRSPASLLTPHKAGDATNPKGPIPWPKSSGKHWVDRSYEDVDIEVRDEAGRAGFIGVEG